MGFLVGWCSAELALAQRLPPGVTTTKFFSYDSSITSVPGGVPISLQAAVVYPTALAASAEAPLAVIMHGYSPTSGNISEYVPRAIAQARLGFVSIVVAMRGRDGSDGSRDSGGLEIYDIYDAVEHIKSAPFFSGKVDPTNVHISGYSGGGGNVMSALTKFPDYFNLGASFFGMSDYGFDPQNGWYFNGANVGGNRTPILDADVGNPTLGDPLVLDKYHARASNLASHNNPYSEIHLFVNDDETISPPVNSLSYRANAVSHATFSGEFDNIQVHLGKSDNSLWIDRNGNAIKESVEIQNWPHGLSSDIQDRGEAWYIDRLLNREIPQPVLNTSDILFVAGYVRTKPFQLFLGDGQNAAGELAYELSPREMKFHLQIASLDSEIKGKLTLYGNRLSTSLAKIELNGVSMGVVDVSQEFHYEGLANGDTLRFLAVPEPKGCCLLTSLAMLGFVTCRHLFPKTIMSSGSSPHVPSPPTGSDLPSARQALS